uniref:Uncharacterized protein n=1 Tax=Oryza glumipatula TaxID=40148 RepID=A0A0E0BTU2_9ORYZ
MATELQIWGEARGTKNHRTYEITQTKAVARGAVRMHPGPSITSSAIPPGLLRLGKGSSTGCQHRDATKPTPEIPKGDQIRPPRGLGLERRRLVMASDQATKRWRG